MFIATKKANLEIIRILLSIPTIDVNSISSQQFYQHHGTFEKQNSINFWKNELFLKFQEGDSYEFKKLYTPLNISVKNQNFEIIELLLSHPKIDLNIKSVFQEWKFCGVNFEEIKENKDTPLLTSIKKNYLDIFNLLLKHPNIEINEKSIFKNGTIKNSNVFIREINLTALSYSIDNDKYEFFQILLSQPKIDVRIKINEKYLITDYIFKNSKKRDFHMHNWILDKKIENTKYLIKDDFEGEFEIIKEVLHIAIYKGNLKIIELLLSRPEIDLNTRIIYKKNAKEKEIESSLHILSTNGNLELFKIILSKSNWDLNEKLVDVFQLIGDKNKNIDLKERTLLHNSVINNNFEMFKLLTSHPKTDINANIIIKIKNNKIKIGTELHYVVINNKFEYLTILLSLPQINVNAILECKSQGNQIIGRKTALHIACSHKNIEIIRLLLKHSNVDHTIKSFKKTDKGKIKEKNILSIIAKTKSSIFSKCLNDMSEHNKISYRSLDILKLLLSITNIDVNEKSITKWENKIKEKSPLNIFTQNLNIVCLKYLLSHQNIDIQSKYIIKSNDKCILSQNSLFIAFINKKLSKYSNDECILSQNSLFIAFNKEKLSKYSKSSIFNDILNQIYLLFIKNQKFDINEKYIINEENNKLITTALNLAAYKGYPKAVKYLLSNSNINENDKMLIANNDYMKIGLSPLHVAILKDDFHIVSILLSSYKVNVNLKLNKIENQNQNQNQKQWLRINFSHSKHNYIEYKLFCGITPLQLAIINNDFNSFYILLENITISVNIKLDLLKTFDNELIVGITALHLAIIHNNIYFIESLLKIPRIDVNIKLDKLILSNKEAIGMTALHLAVLYDNEHIIKLLLDNEKIDVNAKIDKFFTVERTEIIGITALHLAALCGNTNIVKLLLDKKKIDVNAKIDKFFTVERAEIIGMTALHLAVLYGNEYIVKLLLDNKKIDVNAKVNKSIFFQNDEIIGMTALHLAIGTNNFKVIQYLLSSENIDVNEMMLEKLNNNNILYMNALHLAINDNNLEIVTELLKNNNIDKNAVMMIMQNSNIYKVTPVYLAEKINKEEIKNLLGSDIVVYENYHLEFDFPFKNLIQELIKMYYDRIIS